MALDETKKITINGESKIDDAVAERYSAVIDEANPENMTLGRFIVNAQLRKENCKQCRKDQAAFEDDAYAQQDELLKNSAKTEETA
ncbi:MAG: hypothetical protein LUD72_11420 [Bacteroidales bacterium]|nr:hypothetical protein [Bacteroidales bacterium]